MTSFAGPRLVPLLLLAACGGSSGSPDAADLDAAPPDATTVTRYALTVYDPLPDLPFASPFGMNEAGTIVGYSAPEAYHPQALPLRIVDGTVEQLPVDEPQLGFAVGINAAGVVVGESYRSAYAWDDAGQHLLPAGTSFGGAARAISDDGLVVGSYGDADDFVGPQHAYWTAFDAAPIALRGVDETNTSGVAWSINAAGQIAGVSGVEGAFVAVRWDDVAAAPVTIGPLEGALNSEARAINAHGDVVGRSSWEAGRTQAFLHRRDTGELVGLPDGGVFSEAYDLDDARRVVGVARVGQEAHAVLWEGGALADLNDLLAEPLPSELGHLSSAVAINEAGQIAVEVTLAGSDARRIGRLDPVQVPVAQSSNW